MTQRAGRAGRLEPGISLHLSPKNKQNAPRRKVNRRSYKASFRFADGITAMGMQRSGADGWLDQPPTVNLLAAKRLLQIWGRWRVNGLVRRGKKWQRWVRSAFSGNAG